MSKLPDPAAQALDRMYQVADVWHLIADLTASRDDLSHVDRDRMASALQFLNNEFSASRDALETAQRQAVQP